MAQKFIKSQNKNSKSIAFGKYFATAVYDEKFITTEQIADFIQQQCSIKKSDIKAALDELGGAMKHFFELGQKIRLDGIGIFKVHHHRASYPIPARDGARGSRSDHEQGW